MVFTYDVTTDIGKVRMLCRDTVAAKAILTDEEIAVYLEMEGVVKLAAAQALEDKATQLTLTYKEETEGDHSISGPRMAADLRLRAAELRRQVEQDGSFDVTETDWESLV
jgi:hypothetical protein